MVCCRGKTWWVDLGCGRTSGAHGSGRAVVVVVAVGAGLPGRI